MTITITIVAVVAFIIGALVGAAFLLALSALYSDSEFDDLEEAEMRRAVDGARR